MQTKNSWNLPQTYTMNFKKFKLCVCSKKTSQSGSPQTPKNAVWIIHTCIYSTKINTLIPDFHGCDFLQAYKQKTSPSLTVTFYPATALILLTLS